VFDSCFTTSFAVTSVLCLLKMVDVQVQALGTAAFGTQVT
jgi:hypothetical protein